jgi:hypothetical protein
MPDAKAVLENWFDAIEAWNLERITELLADDVTVETETLRQPIRGKQMLRDLLAHNRDAYESIRIERRKVLSSGRDAAALGNVRARFRADVDLAGVTLSTAGKELDIVAAVFVEVNEAGKIARIMRVRDTWGIIDQLGLSPERVKELMRRFEAQTKEVRARAA